MFVDKPGDLGKKDEIYPEYVKDNFGMYLLTFVSNQSAFAEGLHHTQDS